MSSKSDVKLGQFLTLESTMVHIKPQNATKAPLTFVAADDGTGVMLVQGGDSNNDQSGIILLDENMDSVVKITKGMGSTSASIAKTRVYLDGACGNLTLGGNGEDGDVVLRNHSGEVTAHISAQAGRDSNTVPFLNHPNAKMKIDAGLGTYDLGGLAGGRISLRNNSNVLKISLDGQTGKGTFVDVALTGGTTTITSLVNKIKDLEARIAALEAP
ncbi:MAG: hypothetical protein H6581_26095 [Bacteroidia bacterium]|nr:hypothetical protein [Bacteroidia bacterium]